MLLRGGGESDGSTVDLKGVTDKSVDSGILHGSALISFAEAVLGQDDAALASARNCVLKIWVLRDSLTRQRSWRPSSRWFA